MVSPGAPVGPLDLGPGLSGRGRCELPWASTAKANSFSGPFCGFLYLWSSESRAPGSRDCSECSFTPRPRRIWTEFRLWTGRLRPSDFEFGRRNGTRRRYFIGGNVGNTTSRFFALPRHKSRGIRTCSPSLGGFEGVSPCAGSRRGTGFTATIYYRLPSGTRRSLALFGRSVGGAAKMLHARRPGSPVAAARRCASDRPLLLATGGRRCMAWSCMRRFGWQLSMRG